MAKLLPLAAMVVLAILGYAQFGDILSFEYIGAHRQRLEMFRDQNFVLTSVAFVGFYAAIVSLSLPGATIATLAGGFLFGLFPGTLYNVVGATIGATIIFAAARYGLRDFFSEKLAARAESVQKIENGLRRNEVTYLLLMRLIPVVPFFIANLVPALFGTGLRIFIATTFFGIIPGAIAYTWVGVGLDEVLAQGQAPGLSVFLEWHVIGPLVALVLLALLPLVQRRIIESREGSREH